jgi:hypothetical protein
MTRDLDLYPPELRPLAADAVARLQGRVAADAPILAGHLDAWMTELAGGAPADGYFTHPRAFPMLLLPWWAEEAINGQPDAAFQADVVYSSVSGYYFVRLIDDVMDGDDRSRPEVLPGLIVLHTEFQRTYQRHFPFEHPFWDDFSRSSYLAAETASGDAGATEIDAARFAAISSRKVAGAAVPIAAVCHRSGHSELVAPWTRLIDALGRWHQMLNDTLGWSFDLERGRITYLLSEAARRAGPGLDRPAAEWVIDEGLAWAMTQLATFMSETRAVAAELGSAPLMAYLDERQRMLDADWKALEATLEPLRRLASVLR